MWDSISTDFCDVCQFPPRTKTFLDKENVQPALSPVKSEELSFYGSTSPTAPICTGTSPNHCNHNIITRRPLDDHDPNSRDSGYFHQDGDKFSTYASPCRGSFESIGSMEDEFFEDFTDLEPLENIIPQSFGKLLNAPISVQNKVKSSPRDTVIRPLLRRALSLQTERTTPSRVRSCLFKADNERPFKRPEPPLQFGSPSTKKAKINEDDEEVPSVPCFCRPVFKRAISATEESIMSAVQRSSTEPDLIGDFSKPFSLPLTQGRHRDLKSITSSTLAQLIQRNFDGNITSFKIIDCRYPYEYHGGHIDGAINIYTKDQCLELLNSFTPRNEHDKASNILVFHCEFSSERGPNLYRYLRRLDREINQDAYPALHYPEIYLLEGGYKHFFEQYSHLCVPVAYKEMLNPEHENELRYFRQKSKTWNADTRQKPQRNHSKKISVPKFVT